MPLEGPIFDCVCGLRYIRTVIALPAPEHAKAHCPCTALLGEWRGRQRLVFEAEEPLLPAEVG
jgi:hypothetical protein